MVIGFVLKQEVITMSKKERVIVGVVIFMVGFWAGDKFNVDPLNKEDLILNMELTKLKIKKLKGDSND